MSTAAFQVLKETLWGPEGQRFASQLLQTLALYPCSADRPDFPGFPQAAVAGMEGRKCGRPLPGFGN